MKGLLASVGPLWKDSARSYALSRLAHRGPAETIVSSRQRRIHVFDRIEKPLSEGALRIWSFGMPETEKPAALRLALQGRLELQGPSRWKDAFHIVDDSMSGKLTVVRGEFNETPVRWTVESGSLFVAPEYKAFSHPARLKNIHSLRPGCSLAYLPDAASVSVIDGHTEWPRPAEDAIGQEEASRKIERLIREWLIQNLKAAPRPMALAMSGGLDSSIAAWSVIELGHCLPAYTVWYDAGTAHVPNDVVRSRKLAGLWGLEHREIRVTEDDLDEYLEDMIWRSEAQSNIVIEGSLHWLILARRMAADGIRTCISGQGADHLFASFPEIMKISDSVDPYKLWHANVRVVVSEDRESTVTDSYGLGVIGAFKSPALRDLALALPIDLLWKKVGDSIQGKQILRNAFCERLPPPVTNESKINIHRIDNLGVMLSRRYGPPKERLRRYHKLRKKLLKPSVARVPLLSRVTSS